jgi:quinol monooxygenase YgiN
MDGAPTHGTGDEPRAGAVELTGRLRCADLSEAAAVRRHLPEHVALTLAEPGCLRFAVEPTEDPLIWTVSELFVDRAAFEAHQARVRSSRWFEVTSGIERDYAVTTVTGSPDPTPPGASPGGDEDHHRPTQGAAHG